MLKDINKWLAPIAMSLVYIILTGVIKNNWYVGLMSAPAIVFSVVVVVFVRKKLDMMPRGSAYSYFIIVLFMTHVACLLII